ncbi:MAG: TrkA family potassium uptake protein [Actinomycetales bacterium]|nr:TrkA family potassium uptake protein [Actinomycetales bacterium]
MHIVIMGCGRVGSMLAHSLEDLGHSVAVIDQDQSAFRRLGPEFRGLTIKGVGFDREHLIEAGIERAGAFAAVSNGDNSNILAARTVREVFGVTNVIARIYDPKRAEVFERLGIPTVATVSWTKDQILRHILPAGAKEEWRDHTGEVSLSQVNIHPKWFGTSLTKIEEVTGIRIALLTRLGTSLLPNSQTVLQEGDLVHILARIAELKTIEETLAKAPVH